MMKTNFSISRFVLFVCLLSGSFSAFSEQKNPSDSNTQSSEAPRVYIVNPKTGLAESVAEGSKQQPIQIQNVTVQTGAQSQTNTQEVQQKQNAKNSSIDQTALNSAEETRQVIEKENNALLLQQIENERLRTEQKRRERILLYGSESGLEIKEESQKKKSAEKIITPAKNEESSLSQSAEKKQEQVLSEETEKNPQKAVKKSLNNQRKSPFSASFVAGKRFFVNEGYADIQNNFVWGLSGEAHINSWLSVEGSFVYGEDVFEGERSYNAEQYDMSESFRDSYEFVANTKWRLSYRSIKPYVLLGVGALYQKYNIDFPDATAAMNSIGWERSTTHVFLNSALGVDFDIFKNMGLGLRAEYQYIPDSDRYEEMNQWWADNTDRFKITGQLRFLF